MIEALTSANVTPVVAPVAALLSGQYHLPVLTHGVDDSDVLVMEVYGRGEMAHEYVSEMLHLGNVMEQSSGEFLGVVDGVTYSMEDPDAPARAVRTLTHSSGSGWGWLPGTRWRLLMNNDDERSPRSCTPPSRRR